MISQITKFCIGGQPGWILYSKILTYVASFRSIIIQILYMYPVKNIYPTCSKFGPINGLPILIKSFSYCFICSTTLLHQFWMSISTLILHYFHVLNINISKRCSLKKIPLHTTLFFYNYYEHPKKGQLPILLSRLYRVS